MAIYLGNTIVSSSASGASGSSGALLTRYTLPTGSDIDESVFYYIPAAYSDVTEGVYYYKDGAWKSLSASASGGVSNYNDLSNKPKINGVTLLNNTSLINLDIAQLSSTYTKTEVDNLLSSIQKVYVSNTVPTAASLVGLYYVDTAGTGTYEMYLVDTNKSITDLGSAGVSLTGYQKETDNSLLTTRKTVVGAINELKTAVDNINLTAAETKIEGGIFIDVDEPDASAGIDSFTIKHSTVATYTVNGSALNLLNGDSMTNITLLNMNLGHVLKVTKTKATLPEFIAGDNIEINPVLGTDGLPEVPYRYEIAAQTPSLTAYQTKNDTSLNTTAKTVVGAINELAGKVDAPQGAEVTLNGTQTSSASFYAPLTGGIAGQVLKSNGTGSAPTWTSQGNASIKSLNGAETDVADAELYAPTVAGTTGQVLVSKGTNTAPQWKDHVDVVPITSSDYDNLSEADKTDTKKVYVITDDAGASSNGMITLNEVPLSNHAEDSFYAPTAKPTLDGQVPVGNSTSSIPTWGTLLDMIYPVGSLYISVSDTLPAFFTLNSAEWVKLPSGYSLWTSDANLGTTNAGSLPNITGTPNRYFFADNHDASTGGALTFTPSSYTVGEQSGTNRRWGSISINASNCNSVYAASAGANVVRPTSINVSIWKRVS